MTQKIALLLSSYPGIYQELEYSLNLLDIKLVSLPDENFTLEFINTNHFDFLFIPENLTTQPRWKNISSLTRKFKFSPIITILDQDITPDIPGSDGYISLPIHKRLLKAVIQNSVRNRNSKANFHEQSKAALKQSEEKYQVLFNAMREGLALHEIIYNDLNEMVDFRYIDINPGFERITGLSRESLIGRLLSEAPKWFDNDWPKDYLNVAKTGQSFRVEVYVSNLDRHFDIVGFRPQPGQCAAIISDISLRVVHVQEIEGVARLSSALRTAESSSEIIRASLNQIQELIKATAVLIAVRTNQKVTVIDAIGSWTFLIGKHIPPEDQITNIILSSGDILFRDDLSEEQDSFLACWSDISLTFIGLPLIVQGITIGFIGISRPVTISTAETYAITAIAENTASAIHRSMLFEQTKLYAEQLKTVSEIGRILVETLDLQILYLRICTTVYNLLEKPNLVALSLRDKNSHLVTVLVIQNGNIKDNRESLLSDFQPPKELLLEVEHKRLSCINNPEQVQGDHISQMIVPIYSKSRNLGVLYMERQSSVIFNDADAKLIELVTHMGAIALENAILLDNTQRSLQQLTALHTIDTTVAESLDLQLILKIILDQTITLLNLDAADILLYDTKFHKFKFAQGRGFENRFLVQMDMLFEDKANTDILRARKIKRIDDIENSSLEQSLKTSLVDNGFHSYILVPLIAKNQIKGILEIFQKSKTVFDPDWEGFLETLAGQAAIAIDNATMFRELQISYRELKNAYETTLEGWSFALDLRDKETEGHTKRVTKLSISLAHELGLNDEELIHIRRGALLHDIGKMGIPDNILLKPGPLTVEEREIMCKHPVYAYEMLSRIEFLGRAIEIPYYHHEKWDGTGYPIGLIGEEIPLSARIFAIIDVWDSLISDRPYRLAWPKDKVIEYITDLSGSHFDPAIVKVFLKKRIWTEK